MTYNTPNGVFFMIDANDHDAIIRLDTKMDIMLNEMKVIKDLEYRVRAVEKSDGVDSERFRSVAEAIESLRRSQVNTERIKQLEDDIAELKKKGTIFDVVNAIGATLAGTIAVFKQ